MTDEELLEIKEKAIKDDLFAIGNRIRHAFNQGYELGKRSMKIKDYIKIDKTSSQYISCQHCLYSGDEKSVCIQRRCKHAIDHLRECYVDGLDLKIESEEENEN